MNRKRVRRLMTALGYRPRRRTKSLARRGFPGTGGNACMARPATARNDVWTCDVVHDRTASGGSLK